MSVMESHYKTGLVTEGLWGMNRGGPSAPNMLTIVFGGVETILTCLLICQHKQIAICGTGGDKITKSWHEKTKGQT